MMLALGNLSLPAAPTARRARQQATGPDDRLGDSRPADSLEEICRINAACSPRVNAPSDHLAPDGRLPGTAAPTLDTQGEER
jgi:hypothetical protein